MNILFLADIVPFPPNTGIKIRTFNIIKQLAKFHKIYLFAFNHKIMINKTSEMENCKKALKEYCEQVFIFEIPQIKIKYHIILFYLKICFSGLPIGLKDTIPRNVLGK